MNKASQERFLKIDLYISLSMEPKFVGKKKIFPENMSHHKEKGNIGLFIGGFAFTDTHTHIPKRLCGVSFWTPIHTCMTSSRPLVQEPPLPGGFPMGGDPFLCCHPTCRPLQKAKSKYRQHLTTGCPGLVDTSTVQAPTPKAQETWRGQTSRCSWSLRTVS